MDIQELDSEQQEQLKKLWKIYGRQSKMGKQLFAMYNKADKPKIDYPKVRPKTQKEIEAEKQKMMSTKKCPQKTVIQYPQMTVQSAPKYFPVDFIPKRKAESVIRLEIEEYKKKRALLIPANRGVDRQLLVKKLQEKFNLKGGILPKGATLPQLQSQIKFNEKQIQQKAKQKVEKKYKNFSQPLVLMNQNQTKQVQGTNSQKLDDLDTIFDQIVQQIDDRQQYLDSIDHLEQPELKNKIKREMIERIAELQKITQLKNK